MQHRFKLKLKLRDKRRKISQKTATPPAAPQG